MLTNTKTACTQTGSVNLPRLVGGDTEMESPQLTRPRGLRRVGAAASRLALVAGLAVALLVGSLALGPRGEAAASWRCHSAWLDVFNYEAQGNLAFDNGEYGEAADYWARAAFLEGVIQSAGCS